MQHHPRRRPSAALLISILALILAATGTAVAATNLVAGNTLIKPDSLSGNRLVNHSVTGRQINLKKLGVVPRSNSTARYVSTGLVGLKSSATIPGNRKTIAKLGAFSYVGICYDTGAGLEAYLYVVDNANNDAVETNAYADNYDLPAGLNNGEDAMVFAPVSSDEAYLSGPAVNSFSIAVPHGHGYTGTGSIGVYVASDQCAFQLNVMGS